ncbi:FkbM family methyltransferase [Paenibacillus sp. M1]|uniref:FkbM family methyltransferase n=1 Tax=Paenibacillus haidiansis TaxID=1574488 RepID=A0ABU7VWG5_9BACL
MSNEIVTIFDFPIRDINDPVFLSELVQTILKTKVLAEDLPELILRSYGQLATVNELLNNLAIYFWQSQNYDYVIPLLNSSLELAPNYADALYNMGYILHQLGEDRLSLDYLNQIYHKTNEATDLVHEINDKLDSGPAFLKEYSVQMLQEPGVKFPVYVRLGTSDPTVYKQIFQGRDYIFPLSFSPKLIIDGGANVGYGSVLFANAYPEAQIVAIEPEASNYEVLQYNTAPYKHITTVNSGLWNKDTHLKVKDNGLDKWGAMVEETSESDPDAFKAVTISSLMANYVGQEIDILKLDIEGAERELFTSDYEEWLSKVKVLIIELHDVMKPGCSKAFYNAVSNYNFVTFIRGENLVLFREEVYFGRK